MIYLMVSVICPIEHFRKMARKNLDPFFYLICLPSSMNSLTKRDPKGLYEKADLMLDIPSLATLQPSVENVVNFITKNSLLKNKD
jgi:adenylylsulfate kinase-like enzyme